jgi:hypothetical protein
MEAAEEDRVVARAFPKSACKVRSIRAWPPSDERRGTSKTAKLAAERDDATGGDIAA